MENINQCFRPSELNNKAVVLAKHLGRYNDAIAMFSEALAICRGVLLRLEVDLEQQKFPPALSPDRATFDESLSMGFDAITEDDFLDVNRRYRSRRYGSDTICGNPRFIFTKLVTVPERVFCLSHSDYVHLTFVTLYNLALTTHIRALETDLSRTDLKKSLTLYELSYALQMGGMFSVPPCHTMAIVNNIGHVQKMLGNQEKAKQCFDHLLSSSMKLLITGEAEMADIEEFFSNILHVLLRESDTAAAA